MQHWHTYAIEYTCGTYRRVSSQKMYRAAVGTHTRRALDGFHPSDISRSRLEHLLPALQKPAVFDVDRCVHARKCMYACMDQASNQQ